MFAYELNETEKKRSSLPILIWIIFISTIMALVGGEFLGYRLTGWGWVIPLASSLLVITTRFRQISFPVIIWFPWIMIVLSSMVYSSLDSLQRSMQLLCPIVVGVAVSTYRLREEQIKKFCLFFKYFTIGLIAVVVIEIGILFTGVLPSATGLAPQVMTVTLLGSFFAASYALGNQKDLFWWGIIATIPVIAMTRTAIVVTGLTLALTFAPLKLGRRLMIMILLFVVGVGLFYMPRIQHKMFRSGSGEFSDVLSDDFFDSGRKHMWNTLYSKFKYDRSQMIFGHGTGATQHFIWKLTKGELRYPHNDWLLELYDHGIFGITIFALSIVLASIHAFQKSKIAYGTSRFLFIVGASSFVPFSLMMLTDNIIVYASFFGNIHFMILGLAYACIVNIALNKRIVIRW